MSIKFSTVVLLLAHLLSGPSYADTRNVVYVNMVRVLDEAKPAVAASKLLEEAFAPREAELERLQQQVLDADAKIEATTKDAERQSLMQDKAKLVREFKRAEAQFKRDLSVRKNAEYRRIRIQVEEVVRDYAEKNAIGLVLSEGVLFADDTFNITADILSLLGVGNGD